jgi:hypothetical protein
MLQTSTAHNTLQQAASRVTSPMSTGTQTVSSGSATPHNRFIFSRLQERIVQIDRKLVWYYPIVGYLYATDPTELLIRLIKCSRISGHTTTCIYHAISQLHSTLWTAVSCSSCRVLMSDVRLLAVRERSARGRRGTFAMKMADTNCSAAAALNNRLASRTRFRSCSSLGPHENVVSHGVVSRTATCIAVPLRRWRNGNPHEPCGREARRLLGDTKEGSDFAIAVLRLALCTGRHTAHMVSPGAWICRA